MIAGTGLIGVAKDNLPRIGVTPGLTATFAEIELDTETGKFKILEMLCVADCGTVLHPQGLAHQIRGGNVMGIGMAHLERHVYDPKLGIPTTVLLYQAKLPGYLDVPAEIGWGAVEKPDPQNPVGVKGVGEPPQGSGAAAITTAIADALGGHLFNRTPVSTDMILNALSGRPQAHKPLQVNSV
jgi:xanthine dehydrogenase molybdenum-binding subunit